LKQPASCQAARTAHQSDILARQGTTTQAKHRRCPYKNSSPLLRHQPISRAKLCRSSHNNSQHMHAFFQAACPPRDCDQPWGSIGCKQLLANIQRKRAETPLHGTIGTASPWWAPWRNRGGKKTDAQRHTGSPPPNQQQRCACFPSVDSSKRMHQLNLMTTQHGDPRPAYMHAVIN